MGTHRPHLPTARWIAVAGGVLAALACGPAPDDLSNGPEQDLVLDPRCAVETPLEFTLFQELPSGETAPLGPTDTPAVHFGAQGGQHMMIGVGLANPAETYQGVETSIRVSSCVEPCVEPQAIGQATVVNYPGDSRWDVRADGGVDLGPYVTILDYFGDGASSTVTIDVALRDVCDRTGTLQWRGVL